MNELCQCGFSRETFRNIDITAGFQCYDQSPTAVTFRGEIGPSLSANSSQLISYLEQWIATDPTIVVLSSRLSIDSSCSVEISNLNDPECSDVTSTDMTSTDVTSTDVTSTDVTSTDVTLTDVTSTDMTSTDMTSTVSNATSAIVGGVVGGIFIILVAALALIVVISLVRARQKKVSSVGKEDVVYE